MIYDACDNAIAGINAVSRSYTITCTPVNHKRWLRVHGSYTDKHGVIHHLNFYLGPPVPRP